jgi:hypothetical protein
VKYLLHLKMFQIHAVDVNGKVKSSLHLIKHQAMNIYRKVDV